MTEDVPTYPKHSHSYKIYFDALTDEVRQIYQVAEAARQKGFDPSTKVEIPPAHDVAARVEATLDGPVGVAKRIRELQVNKSREEVAFAVAKEIASGELGGIQNPEKAADKAVRVALAILTESITAAPLEGISKVLIRGRDSEQYLALYLAGPIRAAGGTEAAVTVLVADYVRQVLGLPPFKATEEEIERSLEEVELYARNVHLQYNVPSDLIKFASSRLPIMLTGEPTEDFEVSAGRDLERIETNRVRSGTVLVLNDGVVGRSAKLAKIVERLGIKGWEWLEEISEKTSKAKSSLDAEADNKLAPKTDYLADVIGGRPVFSHPSRPGGFRLRYGRSRNTGLAGVGIHPATMVLVEEFLAPGTHIRTERPGKGSIVAPVDTIEGPIVLLKDGSVRQVQSFEEAKKVQGSVERIIALGDILVALGEFLENNHPLAPSGYCEEWWSHDLDHACAIIERAQLEKKLKAINMTPEELNAFIESPLTKIPSPEVALYLSKKLKVPLHPRYTYRWPVASVDEVSDLRNHILAENEIIERDAKQYLVIPAHSGIKRILEKIGIPHTPIRGRKIRLDDPPDVIFAQFGKATKHGTGSTALLFLNSVSDVKLKDRVGFSIGARMGRPEKAQVRKMHPPVQVLFPVGRTMGTERKIERVAQGAKPTLTLDSFIPGPNGEDRVPQLKPQLELDLVLRSCPNCQNETFESRCPSCGTHTFVQYWCSQEGCGEYVDEATGMCPRGHDVNLVRGTRAVRLDMESLLQRVRTEIGEPMTYDLRGVLGLTSDLKIPEYLGKGILRAKHDVYCYRDGTARFDATDAPLTHFTPNEVGVPFYRLRELGYLTDIEGEQLHSDDQILELKVQDVIIPENCGDYMIRVGKFVDDCLEQIYGMDRYYKFDNPEDVIGALIIGLAPHTSAGIIGRIVGFTSASLCYAHPYWHAAKRRNCDGDEDALILVLDALLNFSRSYLPKGRGGFMDAPLVLSVILNPSEVDDESHNMEVCRRYPAQFYEMVASAQHPRAVEHLVDIVASRLDTMAQYEGFKFTHGTSSINAGPKNTRYKTLGTMAEKLDAQLRIATLIDAVDTADVAQRVLSHHFLRDIRGNLRAYSTQKIRCVKCNRIYRRIPLSKDEKGRPICKCGSKLSLTVRQKNISKYLEIAQKMIDEHGLGVYLQQRLQLINFSLDSLFDCEQTVLTDFFD